MGKPRLMSGNEIFSFLENNQTTSHILGIIDRLQDQPEQLGVELIKVSRNLDNEKDSIVRGHDRDLNTNVLHTRFDYSACDAAKDIQRLRVIEVSKALLAATGEESLDRFNSRMSAAIQGYSNTHMPTVSRQMQLQHDNQAPEGPKERVSVGFQI